MCARCATLPPLPWYGPVIFVGRGVLRPPSHGWFGPFPSGPPCGPVWKCSNFSSFYWEFPLSSCCAESTLAVWSPCWLWESKWFVRSPCRLCRVYVYGVQVSCAGCVESTLTVRIPQWLRGVHVGCCVGCVESMLAAWIPRQWCGSARIPCWRCGFCIGDENSTSVVQNPLWLHDPTLAVRIARWRCRLHVGGADSTLAVWIPRSRCRFHVGGAYSTWAIRIPRRRCEFHIGGGIPHWRCGFHIGGADSILEVRCPCWWFRRWAWEAQKWKRNGALRNAEMIVNSAMVLPDLFLLVLQGRFLTALL